MSDLIIGIDLGTTNSEVAAFVDGQVRVLGPGAIKMLPSCVGISPSGELLVGESARNQQLVYPERTVRSIKRKMGSAETVQLGDRTFSPQEISGALGLSSSTKSGSTGIVIFSKGNYAVQTIVNSVNLDPKGSSTDQTGAATALAVLQFDRLP